MRFSCARGSGAAWGGGGANGRWRAMHRAARPGVSLATAYRRGGGGGWDLPPALIAFGLGVGVGGCVTYALVADGRLPLPSGARRAAAPAAAAADGDVAAALAHPAAAHGLPSSSETLRVFESFVSCYDARTRNPRWVAEALTASGSRGGEGSASRAGSAFSEDAALPQRFRARLADFRASGFDRGHLAAAANHRGSGPDALRATFTLSNVSPQVGPGFNRDFWARLEKFTRDLTARYATVHVITGPLFLPQPDSEDAKAGPPGAPRWRAAWQLLGRPPALVAVPTHFFKVVYATGGPAEQPAALGAFVLPNAAIPAAEPLAHFAVPLDALEAAAGLSFFDAPLGGPEGVPRAAFLEVEERLMEALPAPPAGRIAAPTRQALPAPQQQEALPPPPPQKRLPPPPPKEGESGDHAPAGKESALAVVAKPPSPPAAVVAEPSPALVRAARRAGVPAPLCAAEACRLPAENWWLANGGNGNGNGNGAASDAD